jgi:hypothetical protein
LVGLALCQIVGIFGFVVFIAKVAVEIEKSSVGSPVVWFLKITVVGRNSHYNCRRIYFQLWVDHPEKFQEIDSFFDIALALVGYSRGDETSVEVHLHRYHCHALCLSFLDEPLAYFLGVGALFKGRK